MSNLSYTGDKVSWEDVSSPRDEGDLGIKDIVIWNEAAIIKHGWFLIADGEESMWCQWVISYLLKGKSFCHVKISQDSCGFGGKVSNIFLWNDNWHPNNPLL